MPNTNIKIEGIEECLEAFKSLDRELRKNANGELRKASKEIAKGIIATKLPHYAEGSGSPQAAKIVKAAAPKSDRYVVIGVPQRKPRLSGMKNTPASQAKAIGWAIEGGSDYPPFHNPAVGSLVARHRRELAEYAVPRYSTELTRIMQKYGLI